MRSLPFFCLLAVGLACAGSESVRAIRIDVDARSRPWTDASPQGSCLLEGPEFHPYEVKFAHIYGATLGDAWSWLGHAQDDHFPLRYSVTFQGIADACNPQGEKPRMRVRLKPSYTEAGQLDADPDEKPVYDSFDIVLPPGSLATSPVVSPPAGEYGIVPTMTIVRVGGLDLVPWMARVEQKLGHSYREVYLEDRMRFRKRIDSVLWQGDPRRTIELEYCGGSDNSVCKKMPTFDRRIVIDQANRRFVRGEVAP